MVTEDVDLSADPMWASAPDELLPFWLASSAPAPFDQIHGHSSTGPGVSPAGPSSAD